jgi:hypothetical protein
VNDLNCNGFLDNFSYDNKRKGHLYIRYTEIKLFANYARDLL